MEARILKRLASVGEMAKLDLSPGAVTLAPIDGGVLSWYSGVSAAGGVEAQVLDVLERPVSVYSSELQEMADLFDDDQQVRLKADATALVLSAGRRRVSLRYLNQPNYDLYPKVRDPLASVVTVERDAFMRELGYATSVSAVTVANPILTGVRVITSRTALGFQAMNGTSLVFQSAVKAECSEELEIVVPTSDLLIGMRVLGYDDSGTVGIHMDGRSLVLQTDASVVRMATLAGNWPTLIAENLKKLEFSDALAIPSGSVKAIANAARAYKASNEIVIRPGSREGTTILETRESELGQFQEVIDGTMSKPYVFDVADLETASKMTTGSLSLQFAPAMAMAKIGARKLYVLCRVDK